MVTGEPIESEDKSARRSGNKLDKSIYESDESNKFEGSLLKLTTRLIQITAAITDNPTVSSCSLFLKIKHKK